jgi:PTH1 family peptidyl-tRNA hydrolase
MTSRADIVLMGLGNPGSKYLMTRHNVGFLFLDILAQDLKADWDQNSAFAKKTKSHSTSLEFEKKNLLALKPQTYMNLSGQTLEGLFLKEPKLKERSLVVIHDEVDIPFGQMRVKFGGGDAGHNGLKDLRRALGHGDYFRLRIGVGRPAGAMSVADYVLQNFSTEEQRTLHSVLDHAFHTLRALVNGNLAEAQVRASRSGA